MKISKKILSVVSAAAMVLTLTACSDGAATINPFGNFIFNSEVHSESQNSSTKGSTSDFEYDLKEELGGIEITKYKETENVVDIPETIDGEKVVSIGDYAFDNCFLLNSVTIPDSVTSIDNYAFYGCTRLTSITIPKSVTSIGNNVFDGCSKLAEINVDFYNKKYSSKDGVLYSGEMSLTTLECCPQAKQGAITIPDGVKNIGGSAFENCKNISSITIPDSVREIGGSAFDGCIGLTSITIPDSVTIIGHGVFDGCESLSSITIPNSVTSIGGYAFRDCWNITSITIPDSVTEIGEYAFSGCHGLSYVSIPKNVTSIGNGAFYDCDAEITYKRKTYTPENYEELYKDINGN